MKLYILVWEFLRNRTNEVDEAFYDAIRFDLFGTDAQEVVDK